MRGAWAIVATIVACGHGPADVTPTDRIPPDGGVSAIALKVSVQGPGVLEVTGLPVDCRAGCAVNVAPGTHVRLAARADIWGTFQGWSGACTGTDACDLS